MAFQVSQVCQQDRQQAFLEWLPAYLVVVTMASGRICWRRRCRPGAGWMTCFWGVDFKWWDLKLCEMKSLVIFSGRWNEVDFLEYLKPRPKGSATLPEQDSVVEIPFTRWDLDMWALQCWKSLSNSCEIILYEKLAAPQNTHMSTSPLSWNATCCHSSQHPLTFFRARCWRFFGAKVFFSQVLQFRSRCSWKDLCQTWWLHRGRWTLWSQLLRIIPSRSSCHWSTAKIVVPCCVEFFNLPREGFVFFFFSLWYWWRVKKRLVVHCPSHYF